MGGGGKAPKPSQEERSLQAAQTRALTDQQMIARQQLAREELLAPILYKQAGLRPIYQAEQGGAGAVSKGAVQQYIEQAGNADFKAMAKEYMDRHSGGAPTIEGLQQFASGLKINQKDAFMRDIGSFQPGPGMGTGGKGQIVGFEEIVDEESELRRKINLMQLQRSHAALEGTLPVDPALERSLTDEERSLKDIMSDRLGTGWETSTPGIEAMNDFRQRAEELRYAARRDMMTTAEALQLQRQGANDQRVFGGIGQARVGPMSVAELFGQNAGGYASTLQGMRGERMQVGQNKAQTQAAMFGAGGAVVGTAAGVAIAM